VNWRDGPREPIHRWFKYREGFSPQLPEALALGTRVLDPFAGSGSILVGSAQQGREATGLDVNPLAVFIANTKLSPLTGSELRAVSTFAETLRDRWPAAAPWQMPALAIAPKVFEPLIADTMLRIRTLIEQTASTPAVRNFLLLAWIACLESVGSYFKEGNGIKYRNRKRLPTGYERREEGTWQTERFGPDQAEFAVRKVDAQLRMMLKDAETWSNGAWNKQRALEGSAMEADEQLAGAEFDSVVFSPPYANRFDYFESMKVELWFGGFVSEYSDVLALRKRSLRSHLAADLARPARLDEHLESLINLMERTASSWRMGVPDALRGYFHDMWETLSCVRRLLVDGGSCHVVVGNSAFAGVVIPTDALIANLARGLGFEDVTVQPVRHLTVSPQQRQKLVGLENYMRESVVVLR
jgi:site-specific DNA-methyltransferase (adenine-specific)